jgi:hypothetical protein
MQLILACSAAYPFLSAASSVQQLGLACQSPCLQDGQHHRHVLHAANTVAPGFTSAAAVLFAGLSMPAVRWVMAVPQATALQMIRAPSMTCCLTCHPAGCQNSQSHATCWTCAAQG